MKKLNKKLAMIGAVLCLLGTSAPLPLPAQQPPTVADLPQALDERGPDLHDRFGTAFEQAYLRYEQKAAAGELKLHRKVQAMSLWRKTASS